MTKIPLLSLTALCCVLSVQAQQTAPETDTASAYTVGLEEIKVMASFGNPKGQEPVMLSTIGADRILTRLSNREFPQIMGSAPSVYATRQGGGFGDARMTLRGFGSENVALLINGIPVNGMENGSVYWSNWSGLSDVTNSIQVQRGIGLSKLGLFSVGGTVNIITRATDLERQGSAFYTLGDHGFRKMGVTLSSGMLPKGWAFTMMGTRESSNGYIPGTNYEAWSYFLNLSKKIGADHLLSLTAFGAPQWHNRRSNKHFIEDYDNSRDGIRMNDSYGYINGQIVPTYSGYNKYHKPQISLNHYWSIDAKSSLSTSVYMSNASGGGRKVYGKDANRLQYNYKTGRPYDVTSLTPEGLIDYGPVMEDNRSSEDGSQAVFTLGTNSHDWYGMLSSYTNRLNDAFRLTAGVDARYYIGYHYDKITDLLGGAYFKDSKLAWRDPEAELKVGDKVSQDYLSRILWVGGFAQLEYEREHYKAFVSGSVSHHGYRREDAGKYGPYAADQERYPASMRRTDWLNFVPVSVKAGFNYRVTRVHSFFVNGGYVTRPPMMDNIFADNTPISHPIKERIATGEIGYSLHTRTLSVSLNAYYTQWMDKSVTKAIGSWNGPRACIPDIDARHMGIELEAEYKPCDRLRLNGFFTIGNWRWTNDVDFVLYDEQDNKVGEYHAYVKDLHVGNAPQTSAMLSVTWMPWKGLELGADWNFYDRYYADFSPADRTDPDDRSDAWKLPAWSTADINLCYTFKVGTLKAQLIGNVNNLFDAKYISDALDGTAHNRETALVWYGFGTTWTTGLRIIF